MALWDTLLSTLTELDLLKLGEALALGAPPRTAMGALQALLVARPRPTIADLLPHLGDPTLIRAAERAGATVASAADARTHLLALASEDGGAEALTLEVPRRKPRLAWQGMHTTPALTPVPVQVLEVVSPNLAEWSKSAQPDLTGLEARRQKRALREAQNRLIWTNDNLVALETLLHERDPETRDYRYRGKVDLVYIDPPFMVNGNFTADNTIDIPIDEAEGVSAQKEPSLVELLAYKDTWREGLDSFLSMIRARLLRLKALLAPTGSIYVHLDWHAAHYVKVLMDEVFGYENLRNHISWRRTSSHNDPKQFGRITDHLLFYALNAGNYYFGEAVGPLSDEQMSRYKYRDENGRQYKAENLTAPGVRNGDTGDPWRGLNPTDSGRHWAKPPAEIERLFQAGRILLKKDGNPRLDGLKVYLDESQGSPLQDIWTDIQLSPTTNERLGYPTQKPVALLERIISASCPPGGLVLDCFMGSGTTVEAAERLGRRWIGIDNGKYAVHLARKRLIQLHGQEQPPAQAQFDYVECESCKAIERKAKRQKSPGRFSVRPFSVESMGVYLREQAWLDAAGEAGAWKDEMVRVFGGEPVRGYDLLHGQKGAGWIHVGPLDAPVPARACWGIAREAADTELAQVTVLSADLDTLPQSEREEIQAATGVKIVLRIIPRTAIEEVARRLSLGAAADGAQESMAVPAFYTPLAIALAAEVDGRRVRVSLERCEVDVESFLASQRPALKPVTEKMSASARKKAEAEVGRWEARRAQLEAWLGQADSWPQFVDFWAVDWDYADHLGADRKPIFDTDWQSFRIRRGKKQADPLVLVAETTYERPGRYQVAARVTDVFGNDGVAVVEVEVGR